MPLSQADVIAAQIRCELASVEEQVEEIDAAVRQQNGLGDDEEACLHYRSEDYESIDNLTGQREALERILKFVTGEKP